MELWELYLLVTLPSVGKMFGTFGALGMGAALICGICYCVFLGMAYNDDDKKIAAGLLRATKYITPAALILMTVGVAIPSKSGLYTIVGGYYATNLEGAKDLPPNILKAANKFLEQYNQDQLAARDK